MRIPARVVVIVPSSVSLGERFRPPCRAREDATADDCTLVAMVSCAVTGVFEPFAASVVGLKVQVVNWGRPLQLRLMD
jgi:hypothetical protein